MVCLMLSGAQNSPRCLRGGSVSSPGVRMRVSWARIETGRERQREGRLRVLDLETTEYEGQAVRENGSIIDLTPLRRGW